MAVGSSLAFSEIDEELMTVTTRISVSVVARASWWRGRPGADDHNLLQADLLERDAFQRLDYPCIAAVGFVAQSDGGGIGVGRKLLKDLW